MQRSVSNQQKGTTCHKNNYLIVELVDKNIFRNTPTKISCKDICFIIHRWGHHKRHIILLQIILHDLLELHYLSSFTKSFLSPHITRCLYHVWHLWAVGKNLQAVINLFLYIYIFIFLYLSYLFILPNTCIMFGISGCKTQEGKICKLS